MTLNVTLNDGKDSSSTRLKDLPFMDLYVRIDAAERNVAKVERELKPLEEVKSHNSELVRKYKKRKLDREGHEATDQEIVV